MATGLGVMLSAALVLAIVDIVHTGGGPLPLLGLWALVAIPAALGTGVVLAGGNGLWGVGWVRGFFHKLRVQPELDRTVVAILITAAIAGAILAVAILKLSLGLVADVQRKETGAMLLAVAVIALIPIIGLGSLPIYKALRWFMGFDPIKGSIGPFSRVVLLLVVLVVLGAATAAFIISTKLDYQSINLGSLVALALLPVIAILIGLVAYGPLGAARERVPARGVIALVGLVLATVLPIVGLRTPSDETRLAVTNQSYLGPRAIPPLRKFFDHDKDGHSTFFGDKDCDDNDPTVYPGAPEIADNGKDDNCNGGDSHAEPVPVPKVDAGVTGPTLSGGKNVLVIFVDTLRFDRLGFTGYQRDGKSLTPAIDELAKQAVVFEKAYSQAPNTPRSVPSFLGSRYPTQIAVPKGKKTNYPMVLDDNDLLFEVLKPAGFTTIGMTSHFYFCDRVRAPDSCKDVAPWLKSNIQQGADEWDNSDAVDIPPSNKDIAGPRIVKKAIARLEQAAKADTKFAMLVHLFEPHSSYMEHDGYPITEHGTASLAQKYDYEIVAVDQRIGELLAALDKTGLAKTTTVVIMSDHGEAFGVHRVAGQQMFFHGQTLYNELIHVPLIFRVPGVAARKSTDVVQLLDLAPTIAELFGAKRPASWQGRSLVPALEGKPLDPKPAFAEMVAVPDWDHESRSMITADGKRHVLFDLSDWEIYDLDGDRDETKNVVKSDPDSEKLQQGLSSWIDRPQN
ncbi:MAG: sulfatase-like hydrolase/transferase [Kofleriaceae bacterium]